MAVKINIKTLLEAGCHYGHQTRRWNPKMKPYIFGERNGIYILDLKQTVINADQAYSFIRDTTAKGGSVLFVGTKKQAQEPIATQAAACSPTSSPCVPVSTAWRSLSVWSRTAAWLFAARRSRQS